MRLLVAAYYTPPAGGAGVQRVLKWTKYLPAAGIEPTLLTVREGAYPTLDPTLAADLPPEVAVHRTAALDPFGVYARLTGRDRSEAVAARTDDVGRADSRAERLARWLRANVFVPDARVGWVPFAVAEGRRLIREARRAGRPFDAVLTSGPPHSAHLVGLALRRRGLAWIADFRDPWTDIHYLDALPRTAAARRLDAALERHVLRTADAVTTVSPAWGDLLAVRRGRSVHVIENGFDPADFAAPAPPPAERFELVHVGSLYASRNPVALWTALAQLRDEGTPIPVRLVGRVGEEVAASARDHGVELTVEPYVPHAEAVAAMRAAPALLLTTEPQAHEAGHVTGKVYEYLAAGRPVLALGDPDGDAARLLDATGSGRVFARGDKEGVATWLREAVAQWGRGGLRGAEPEAVAPYARDRQAAALAQLVRSLV